MMKTHEEAQNDLDLVSEGFSNLPDLPSGEYKEDDCIRLGDLTVSDLNPRQDRQGSNLKTVGELGLLQPITLRPIADSDYEVLLGSDRYRALLEERGAEGPLRPDEYKIVPVDDEQAIQMVIAENEDRSSPTPYEYAQWVSRIKEKRGESLRKLAEALDMPKAKNKVSNYLNLAEVFDRLPESWQLSMKAVPTSGQTITINHFAEVQPLLSNGEVPESVVEFLDDAVKQEWSVHRLRDQVTEFKKHQKNRDASKPEFSPPRTDSTDQPSVDAPVVPSIMLLSDLILRLHRLGWEFPHILKQARDRYNPEITKGLVQAVIDQSKEIELAVQIGLEAGVPIAKMSRMMPVPEPLLYAFLPEGMDDTERLNLIGIKPEAGKEWHISSSDLCISEEPPGLGQIKLNLIHHHTKPGDWVLDLTAGGGHCLDACLILGRCCFGVEHSGKRGRPEPRQDVSKSRLAKNWPLRLPCEKDEKPDLIFINLTDWQVGVESIHENALTTLEAGGRLALIGEDPDQIIPSDSPLSCIQQISIRQSGITDKVLLVLQKDQEMIESITNKKGTES